MTLYRICIALHLFALTLWLGHMFVWSLVVGPAMKRIEPKATADLLRERSQFHGGLGWPALAILVPTGLYLLHLRGIHVSDMLSGAAFAGTQGAVLAVKLSAVLFMVFYQAVFAHRPSPIAIYFDMLAALIIIGASVVLVRGWLW